MASAVMGGNHKLKLVASPSPALPLREREKEEEHAPNFMAGIWIRTL